MSVICNLFISGSFTVDFVEDNDKGACILVIILCGPFFFCTAVNDEDCMSVH